jgi:formylglycine-generating enzyme required for sulfatase activity
MREGRALIISATRLVRISLLVMAVLIIGLDAHAQLDRLRKLKKNEEAARPIEVPMATVPAGDFWMGVDGMVGLEDERPRHKVILDAFLMDRQEVTTAQYAAFLTATGRPLPLFWEQVNLQIHGDRPVIGVDWHDADEFCRWSGKRLPTEAEWEKAARGTDERLYP